MPDVFRDNLLRNRAVRELASALRAVFRRQALAIASKITLDGGVPETADWVDAVADVAKPHLLKLTQQGIVESDVKRGRRASASPMSSLRTYVVPIAQAFVGKSYVMKSHRPDATLSFDLFNPRVIDAVNAATYAFCRETMDTARSDLVTALNNLRAAMRAGLHRGEAFTKLAERVHEIFADPYRTYRIAVTEASRAQHTGQLIAARQTGLVKYKSWVASSDACEQCLELGDRDPIPLDQPFYVDPRGGPYAVVHAPPLHPFCLLPETTVTAPETVRAMMSLYSGTCFRITLANGDRFACTPNHMLLTTIGMLTASSIMEGDYVIYSPLCERLRRDNPNYDWQPTSIEEVFNSLAIASGVTPRSVPVSPEYLHGDAAFCDGNIYVVEANGLLWRKSSLGPDRSEPVSKLPFRDSHLSISLNRERPDKLCALLHRLASQCDVSGLRHLRSIARGHDRVCDRMGPMLYPISPQHFEDCPASIAILLGKAVSGSRRRRVLERIATDSEVSVYDFLLDGVAEPLRCTHVEPFTYDGPVYDLQTRSSLYYISSGVVGSNCFCSMNEEIE